MNWTDEILDDCNEILGDVERAIMSDRLAPPSAAFAQEYKAKIAQLRAERRAILELLREAERKADAQKSR